MATPTPGQIALRGPLTPEQFTMLRWEREIEERNKPLSDEELDAMFPLDGYKVLEPPASYVPIRTPARKLLATPTPMGGAGGGATPLYAIPEEDRQQLFDVGKEVPGLPNLKPEDYQYFGALLNEEEEEKMSAQEKTERKIMKLLLKVGGGEEGSGLGLEWERGRKMGWCGWDGKEEVKNGTPPQRKTALRQLTDKAREFGASALFNQILPLLMSPTLEDQERHLLVKVIDRILYKLDELVRPFVHKILVVIEPLLIDEDYYARVEGREIISNLSKAAGLATMIAAMRPDIDNVDEYVRNTTARAFSVVASALGIPALLPFLRAVCASKKSWQARHTGIKIVQQIAILMGCAVLPHLRSLVDIIEHGLGDDNQKVRVGVGLCMCVDSIIELSLACSHRTITSLSLAAIGEASAPYSIESFYFVRTITALSLAALAEASALYSIESFDSVRTITALSLAALAEASAPYGIESFDSVLKPLWKGIRAHRGKVLAAFLKAIGFIIPLMDAMYASYYTREGAHGGICVGFIIPLMDAMYASYYTREVRGRWGEMGGKDWDTSVLMGGYGGVRLFIIPLMDAMYASYCTHEVMVVLIREFQSPDKEMKKIVLKVMVVLIREFQSPDEEMKKIVLKVVKQCVGTDGVEPDYIRTEILPEYFKHFWVRRMALDRRNYKQLVETTVEIANKVSGLTSWVLVWGATAQQEILPEYFKHFWVRRMALDRRNYKQLVETMVKIANKAGVSDIIGRVVEDLKDESGPSLAFTTISLTSPYPSLDHISLSTHSHPLPPTTPHPQAGVSDIIGRVVEDLKDESEPYRRMVMETVEKVLTNLGAADIDARLEELLIDGILYAFQEQTVEKVLTNLGAADIDARLEELLIDGILYAFQERTSDDANVMLNGFGTVVNALGQRVRPYLPQVLCSSLFLPSIFVASFSLPFSLSVFQICGTVKWRLNNKSAKVRQQAADLIARIAVVMKACGEEQLMGHLGVVLYEYLGEARVRQQAADLIARIAVVMKACGEEQLMGHLGVVLYDCADEGMWEEQLMGHLAGHRCGVMRSVEQLTGHLGVVFASTCSSRGTWAGSRDWHDQNDSPSQLLLISTHHTYVTHSLALSLPPEYPEVLGSILGALKVIVNVIGMTKRFPSTPCCSYPHINAHPTCVTLSPNCAMPLPLPPEYPEDVPPLATPSHTHITTHQCAMHLCHPLSLPLIPPEYPEVLGSILGALKAIVNVIGMTKMTPPIKDLLPRLTPILKNRHEKVQKKCIADRQSEPSSLQSVSLPVCVLPTPLTPPPYDFPTTPHYHSQVQENCIDLVGRIADRGAEFVPAREWMRICFELLDMLKVEGAMPVWESASMGAVPGKQTSQNIAKAIGPQDVLATLLNNHRVQERQNKERQPIFFSHPAGPSLSPRHTRRESDAHKKGIRRATVNTFGYIAKAIGPQDVLATLLNNLKVQERQNRVCTTVAIAIVAETCSPFTVLPALMNEIEVSDGGAEQPQGAGAAEPRVHHRALVAETCSSFTVLPALMSEYRVPELNVQNGVLKSLSFLFEYIGEMGRDYIYAVTPLLEDALMDRDLVHRQTAASAVMHMTLGVAGLGCEDALTSPHLIQAVMGTIDGMRVALGPALVLGYVLQGLYHPARKVREVYWRIYNNLYIGAQDALTAAYPRLPDEPNNTYTRAELDMFI
ncbi:unnamed protein product [Closterium sp. NIES-65]|nr:unnamed protein product [Closterium sp. NIES-65]